jgi:hypothetical protein
MIRRRRPREADIESFRDWLFTQLLTPGQFGDRKIQQSLRSPTRVLKDVENQNPRLNRPAFDARANQASPSNGRWIATRQGLGSKKSRT